MKSFEELEQKMKNQPRFTPWSWRNKEHHNLQQQEGWGRHFDESGITQCGFRFNETYLTFEKVSSSSHTYTRLGDFEIHGWSNLKYSWEWDKRCFSSITSVFEQKVQMFVKEAWNQCPNIWFKNGFSPLTYVERGKRIVREDLLEEISYPGLTISNLYYERSGGRRLLWEEVLELASLWVRIISPLYEKIDAVKLLLTPQSEEMKTVYVLISNGRASYYKTKAARDRDYVSQDYCTEIQISPEDYKMYSFEEDKC